MSFVSAAQKQSLKARLEAAMGPIDGGKAASAITQAICEWLEQDMLPTLTVLPGQATVGGPTSQVTVSPGMVK